MGAGTCKCVKNLFTLVALPSQMLWHEWSVEVRHSLLNNAKCTLGCSYRIEEHIQYYQGLGG